VDWGNSFGNPQAAGIPSSPPAITKTPKNEGHQKGVQGGLCATQPASRRASSPLGLEPHPTPAPPRQRRDSGGMPQNLQQTPNPKRGGRPARTPISPSPSFPPLLPCGCPPSRAPSGPQPPFFLAGSAATPGGCGKGRINGPKPGAPPSGRRILTVIRRNRDDVEKDW